jgi:hypothetical protein
MVDFGSECVKMCYGWVCIAYLVPLIIFSGFTVLLVFIYLFVNTAVAEKFLFFFFCFSLKYCKYALNSSTTFTIILPRQRQSADRKKLHFLETERERERGVRGGRERKKIYI